MKKGIWVPILIFVLYVAIIVALGFFLPLEGSKRTIFIVALLLVGALALVAALIYKRKAIDLPAVPEAAKVEADNLANLVKAANTRLKASPGGAKNLASMPLVYVLGDENSGKTQTILQSGLDPELLAGEVYRDGMTIPTQLANIWYTGSAAVVEAGGPLLRQPSLWARLVHLTQPGKLGSALSKGALQPTRAAILCVSIERITAGNADTARKLGQTLNERLRELSQTLGISLPVYVLFTKLDTVASFAPYAGNLTEAEVRDPLGAMLSRIEAGAGLYAERANTEVAARFDELSYSLAEYRTEVLSRGGPMETLAKAYEFPRDLRKQRASIVDFLVEVGRPSQLGVNPFLRGFYFSGIRAHMVDEGPAASASQQASAPAPSNDGATKIFSFNAAQAMAGQAAPVASRGQRRVPQWVFLPHLFPRVVLGDRAALDTSRESTKVNFVKRALIASLAAAFLLYLLLLTVSYFNNGALEAKLKRAAAMSTGSVTRGDVASTDDLQNLEGLRQVFLQISGYRKDGAPLFYRFGLYPGDRLYDTACHAYGAKFRTLLLQPTQSNILARFVTLPVTPPPSDEYTATYRPLRAYLITTSNPEHSTPDTADALLAAWAGTKQPPQASSDLALQQFQTYTAVLPEPDSCMAKLGGAPREPAVAQARQYLSHFQGFEQVYLSMKAAADRKFKSINFNRDFPGTAKYVTDTVDVEGAYTKGGFTFMQDAILHPEPYTSGEVWVLGPQQGPGIDRAMLNQQLPPRYLSDFLAAWRAYMKAAHFVPGGNWTEVKERVKQAAVPGSALTLLFQVISTNTAVPSPSFSQPFQATQAVVPPNGTVLPGGYVGALNALASAISGIEQTPGAATDPSAAMPVVQSAIAAESAVSAVRGTFVPPDSAGHVDEMSESLLLAPIRSTQALAKAAPAAAAGGGAKTLCTQLAPVLGKFPFNPDSREDASLADVNTVFGPQGMIAQYAQSQNKMILLVGNQYVQAPGSAVDLNPGFLHFMNSAAAIAAAFVPTAGAAPKIEFSMLQESSPGLPPATIDIDGQQLTTAGSLKTFNWVSTPGSRIHVTGGGQNSPDYTGPWSLLHFAYEAKHPGPRKLEFIFAMNGRVTQSGGVPLDYKFNIGGPGAPLLEPSYMRNLHCVAKVGK